ncbi:MAG: glycosyltransferase, partial [Syntrophobacterales bacterium]
MIKALFLIEDTSYQFDSRVRREIITLQAMGIEAIVICPANAFDESAVYEENGVKVYRYYVENRGKGIKAHLREYALSLFHQTFLTAKVFRKHGFSVIHLGNHSDLFWLVVLPYKLMGKIFIYDQHDPVPELFDIRFGHRVPGLDHLVRLFEKVSYMFADHVITINETCQKLALTRGGKSPNQVTVVRNGPNLRDFPEVIPDPRVRALGRTIVGYLGNMNLQDNLEVFIEMARILHLEKKRTDIGFVMVGSGTDWLRLKSLRDKLRLTDVIYMPGRLAWEDVLSTMAAT